MVGNKWIHRPLRIRGTVGNRDGSNRVRNGEVGGEPCTIDQTNNKASSEGAENLETILEDIHDITATGCPALICLPQGQEGRPLEW